MHFVSWYEEGLTKRLLYLGTSRVGEPLFHKHTSVYEEREEQATKAQGVQGLWENELN